jgi:hypothetical protein
MVAGGAQIGAFVQEGGIDLPGGLIHEAVLMEDSQHLTFAFRLESSPGRVFNW